MASKTAVALRRSLVITKLKGLKDRLRDEFGVEIEEQKITNLDPDLAAVQQLENVAAVLEGAMSAIDGTAGQDADAGASQTEQETEGQGKGEGEESETETTPQDSEGDENAPADPFAIFHSIDRRALEALREAGIDTVEKVAATDDEALVKLSYITPITVEKMRAQIAENATSDDSNVTDQEHGSGGE